jgi:hypothetical protein
LSASTTSLTTLADWRLRAGSVRLHSIELLAHADSLREICNGPACSLGKLKKIAILIFSPYGVRGAIPWTYSTPKSFRTANGVIEGIELVEKIR